jgi:large subunit ribosomal protein L32
MAVPKQKKTRSKRDMRRSSNSKPESANLAVCPQCHEAKLSHHVCPHCGYYKGKQAVEVE